MKKLLLSILILTGLTVNAQWIEPSQVASNSQNVYSLLSDGTNIYAGTGSAGVSLSSDYGNSWTAINNGLFNTNISSFTISGTNIFTGTNSGVFLSTNSGSNWFPVSSGLANLTVNALSTNGTNVFAGTNSGVFISSNNGLTWSPTTVTSQVQALAANGSTLFAGTSNAGIYKSTNNGSTWTDINNGITNYNIRSLAIMDTNIFAGTSGGVYVSTNNSGLWTLVNNGLSNLNVYALYVSGTTIFVGTDDGVHFSNDFGASWTAFNTGFPANTAVQSFTVSGGYIFAGIRFTPNGVWRRSISEAVSITDDGKNISTNIYPNPFSRSTTLQLDKAVKDATLKVYNSIGVEVIQTNHLSGHTITFERNNLPSGIYFIHLKQENKVLASHKLVIID